MYAFLGLMQKLFKTLFLSLMFGSLLKTSITPRRAHQPPAHAPCAALTTRWPGRAAKAQYFDPRNHAFAGGFETPPANEFSRAMRRATIHGVDAFDPHNQFYQSFHMIHSKAAAR
ncbi:hypothetical protein HFO69_32935 [Rhizobium laguerreae]|uniref:hypothetical protein n=1 Tax=Rhizobium laguerreae TaxID=1076926 RepID=UPI001C929B6A|nr:hypothetical protein [Rhizobium laguerreae]MBY3102448.1 hypothetical protein [Rhizobium laguerreae]